MIEVNDQSGGTYTAGKQIRFKTPMLRSDLCDYSDAYILVKGTITVENPNNINYDKKLVLKNNAPFISCISKINGELIENVEDLDIVMPMYDLLEYSKNYEIITGSMFTYYRDEPNSGAGSDDDTDDISYSIKNSKSFNYKIRITEQLINNSNEKDVEIAVPLKYLGNFWRNLNMPLICCEIYLNLSWGVNCVLASKAKDLHLWLIIQQTQFLK